MRRTILVGSLSVLVAGCSSVPPAQVGQAAGTVAGGAIVPGLGAPIGGLIGLVAGLLVQGQIDKATETHERKELGDRLASAPKKTPDAAPPVEGQPIRVWVDETVQDGRLIAGHFDVRYLQ